MKKKVIKQRVKNCPSPENPCMCYCHLEQECWECKMGRHKPKYEKET